MITVVISKRYYLLKWVRGKPCGVSRLSEYLAIGEHSMRKHIFDMLIDRKRGHLTYCDNLLALSDAVIESQ